jgi:hypothetical protein
MYNVVSLTTKIGMILLLLVEPEGLKSLDSKGRPIIHTSFKRHSMKGEGVLVRPGAHVGWCGLGHKYRLVRVRQVDD